MRLDPPFVFLDDARPGGAPARLYRRPARIVRAGTAAEVMPALADLRDAQRDGLHAAGFLRYEAGAAFEPAAEPLGHSDGPLLWFGLFDRWDEVADVAALLPHPAGAWIGAPEPDIDRAAYDARFAAVQDLIRAGDLYQANLTFRARARFDGDVRALYAQLRRRAAGGWGALVETGEETILSFSPELFASLDGDRLLCRPMKGTARRGDDSASDTRAAAELATDAKQRAENLMIVDLMRNDLARVAAPGSVAVPDLFRVETYPTVHQLVSDVTARLAPGKDAVDMLAALFPCGSITGAPKVRAMQALAAIEGQAARGIYTGSIGRIDANGDAAFNVAIRTLHIAADASHATMGLGGGVVADSSADAEWDEACAKGAFVATLPGFDLIETMAFDPEDGLFLLEGHLTRMKNSAEALGFAFDRHAARNELQAATFRLRGTARIRLLLAASGAIAVEMGPMPDISQAIGVTVVPLPVTPADMRLRHKTSDRGFYDAARHAAGTAEVLFERSDGRLTEGSYTNLFVERDGVLLTPPLADGLLPGVLRADLIQTGRAREATLTRDDLAGPFFVGNALRGLIHAFLVPSSVAVEKQPAASL
ncbi:para-aminobenzoate synthetase / 4-amino-4-deoxychorismate lyase [Sphingomonas gellani]|uniref:Probable branched-chain-amino-acid aminotransferase n=1 Tax=Sphingomonas gellani TaxID=1166340 RepID=A0A1H8IYW2_9SPHN|nr:aminodeoxychorismate synthase component I [Sphingomonas gellani]SEN73783.1 para-aminobenzoate synthetase / 4-amino-4-deoxychorismate lyase [Sphingomonas gellani]